MRPLRRILRSVNPSLIRVEPNFQAAFLGPTGANYLRVETASAKTETVTEIGSDISLYFTGLMKSTFHHQLER